MEARRPAIESDFPNARLVLVIAGTPTNHARKRAAELGIEIWDRDTLLSIAPPSVVELYRAALRRETAADKMDKVALRAQNLKEKLESLEPGKEDWSHYQKLVSDIMEFLFSPPLGEPALEDPDETRHDRRDMILANRAEGGPWSLIRQQYHADYIVVDAKNHSKPLGKRSILEVAHYLKPYGTGMFALVVCRSGLAASGRHAVKEQWIGSGRMIVVLTDEALNEMLNLKARRSVPEVIIEEAIRQFRLSL
jgi:hypothetical protein